MYKDHFGFNDKPFSITPNPHYLYMSERHREALAHLIYGLHSDSGFVLLTGEVGTGKTTICRCLLEQIPDKTEIAFIINPKLSTLELLATICDELQINYPVGNSSIKLFIDEINRYLLKAHAAGHKIILIIDEAQNLTSEVLEQIRLLTNLETNQQKLLQIIMIGQPELKQMLDQPQLRQLNQRITARYHLQPLSATETDNYINHRMKVAGVVRTLFPRTTTRTIHHLSGGFPRIINLLCERALLGAYVQGHNSVSMQLVKLAALEQFGKKNGFKPLEPYPWFRLNRFRISCIGAAVIIPTLALMAYVGTSNNHSSPQPTPPATTLDTAQEAITGKLVWPQQLSETDSLTMAQHILFQLWGYSYPPHGMKKQITARDFARQHGLRYLTRHGSLGQLVSLNRPAVLTMISADGHRFYATLIAIDNNKTTLTSGDSVQIVSTTALINQWQGEFSLLWQPPPTYRGGVKPGEKGEIVTWIASQLAQLNPREVNIKPSSYLDGQLLRKVKRFQASLGLDADGIVGPVTIIHLNNLTSKKQPHITGNRKG